MLRLEIEALRKDLKITKDRVQVLETELHAQKARQRADDLKVGPVDFPATQPPPVINTRSKAKRIQWFPRPELSGRARSEINLKHIALAMHNFHDANRRLPARATYDKDGKPLLSWRVLLLPYLDQGELYQQFHLDEPWDSEHNRKLLAKMPGTFSTPGADAKAGETNYLAFVGKGSFFEGNKGLRLTDFTDGLSNTIMIVEAAAPVSWTKPEDLPYDAAKRLPKLGVDPDQLLAALGDGSVRSFPKTIKPETLRLWITRNGGEVIPPD